MQLYLMQHGQALAKEEDPERPLSPAGVAQIQATAAAMKRLGIGLEAILCSPRRRSHQSAALVAEALRFPYSDIVTSEQLAPQAPPAPVLTLLRELAPARRVLIAGHLPSLAEIASLLLTAGPPVPIGFENGGLCGLELSAATPGAGLLRCCLSAAQLRLLAGKI